MISDILSFIYKYSKLSTVKYDNKSDTKIINALYAEVKVYDLDKYLLKETLE